MLAHRHLLWRHAGLMLGRWKHARFPLGELHHLAAHVIPSQRWVLRVVLWSHTPWLDDGASGGRWRRSTVCNVARYRWLLRQRASRLAPLLIEVTHRAVAKKLPRREQSGLCVHLAAMRVG